MTRNRTLFVLGAAFAGALLVATTGCETESASDLSINISPSGGILKAGQTVHLTASGGWNYHWSCNQDNGYLSSTTGSSVNYTAFPSASNATHTITVTGVGTPATSNNTTFASSYSASAVFKSE